MPKHQTMTVYFVTTIISPEDSPSRKYENDWVVYTMKEVDEIVRYVQSINGKVKISPMTVAAGSEVVKQLKATRFQ